MHATEGEKGSVVEEEIASWLLKIGAVSLSPRQPYTWASGVKSPIYCDCRRVMSFPEARSFIENAWAGLIREKWPGVEALMGVATGGIPHAAFVAERLRIPMAYVRPKAKGHGLEKRVEGWLEQGTSVVVMEDLVSTGSSLLEAIRETSKEGAKVLGASAIFTYELPQSKEAFEKEGVPLSTLTRFSTITRVARKLGSLSQDDVDLMVKGMASVVEQLRAKDR
jgi:orotate phosphoribosyltransferase